LKFIWKKVYDTYWGKRNPDKITQCMVMALYKKL